MTSGAGAAGKRNFAHQRMTRQRIANHRSFPRQHAQQPRRQTGLLEDPRQLQRHQRRRFRGFEDHRIAGGDRRRHFLHFAGDRRVPRGDRRHHAQRLVAAQGQQVCLTRRRQLSFQQLAGGGEVAGAARRAHHQASRFRQRLAVVAALHPRQLIKTGFDNIRHFMQDLCPQMGQHVAPRWFPPGTLGAGHRVLQIVETGRPQRCVHRTVRRKVTVHQIAAAVAPATADKNR